jgi:hypothetical protein
MFFGFLVLSPPSLSFLQGLSRITLYQVQEFMLSLTVHRTTRMNHPSTRRSKPIKQKTKTASRFRLLTALSSPETRSLSGD